MLNLKGMKEKDDIFASEPLRQFLFQHHLLTLERKRLMRGISNDNYLLGGQYVLKVPYDPRFLTLTPEKAELENQAAKHFLSPQILAADYVHGYAVSEFLSGYEPIVPAAITLTQVSNLVALLKNFAMLPKGNLKELDYERMLTSFRLLVPPKERIYISSLEYSPLLKQRSEVTHFDLVDNNILTDAQGSLRLIDYEFACLAPRFFDLISLLGENQFKPEICDLFLASYFEDDKEAAGIFFQERKELTALADLLWYHWALARSDIKDPEKKKSFLAIADLKKASLLNYLRNKKG
jgi:hypothetical protein